MCCIYWINSYKSTSPNWVLYNICKRHIICSTSSSKNAKVKIPTFPKYNYEKIITNFVDQIMSSNNNMIGQTFGFV